MKVKILIAVFLCLGSFAFIYKEEFKNKKPENIPVNKAEIKLTPQEQQNYLEYLLGAKSYKLECETDYRNIETGQVFEDYSEYGSGEKVIHFSAGRDDPGYIRGAKIPKDTGYIKTQWSNDTLHSIYFKPRMRIQRELIYPMKENFNDQNLNTQICRLEIVNTEGKVIREVEYLAKNFTESYPDDEGRLYYSGNYLEGFGGYLGLDSLIIADGKEINPKGRSPDIETKYDLRIYWYGYADVWLDFIEVKNNTARELLNGNYDTWLKAMDNVSAEKIEQFKTAPYQQTCYEYIIKKLNKNEFSLR